MPLLGRHRELEEIGRLLGAGTRLLTITGRGGVGKTGLALEAASRVGAPVLVTALAGIEHRDALVPAILDAAGVSPPPGTAPLAALVDHLSDGPPPVLVLDGCERVPEARLVVRQLLDEVSGLVVLATSQRPLGAPGEHVVRLGPLPVPAAGVTDVSRLAEVPSVALFCERARAADHRFELDAANAEAVAELCRRLDGLPLALEVAGGRARTLSVSELVRLLDRGLLRDGLRAALESTCALLDPYELRLLHRLSVLAGPFGLDVALGATESDTVDEAVLDHLSTLVDLHLVDPVDGPDGRRFMLPSTIRSSVREQIDVDGTAAVHRAAYTDWCAATAWRADPVWVSAEHHLLEDALQDAVDRGLGEQSARLVAALGPHWDRCGHHEATHALVQRALALTEGLTSKAAAQALTWSALLALHSVHDEPAVVAQRIERALAIAADLGDEVEELRALSARVLLAPYTGDLSGAAASVERGLALAAGGGHEGWLARFEVWGGMLAHQSGELDRAVELGRAGVERARRLGDDKTLVHASLLLLPLVGSDRRPGDPSVEEALAAARRAEALHLELALLPMRTALLLATGDPAVAAAAAREALVTARRAPSAPASAFNLMAAASVLERLGRPTAAARIHGAVFSQLGVLERYVPRSRAHGYGQMVDRVQRTLGAVPFGAAVAGGGALSIAQCIDVTLAALPSSGAAPPANGHPPTTASAIPALTAREQDVLDLVVDGRTNREIAADLSLSPKTVMHHTGAIYRKLGVRGRAEAITRSLRHD